MAFNVAYSAGGSLDKVKELDKVKVVEEVKKVSGIHGFPTFTQPYNTMIRMDVPAIKKEFTQIYTTPDYPVELVSLSVTCTGYGELDKYDLFCDNEIWFENWYCQEVKEGLYIGSSMLVHQLPPNTPLKLVFKNESGTSKIVWFGLRMLRDRTEKEPPETVDIGGDEND